MGNAILKALRARDPDATRDAMADHVRHIGTLLIDHLAELGRLGSDE